jgi:hypothetical protein
VLKQLKKNYAARGLRCEITAPSCVATNKAGGSRSLSSILLTSHRAKNVDLYNDRLWDSQCGELIRGIDFLLIYAANLTPLKLIDRLDQLSRRCMNLDTPFGGLKVLFSFDVRDMGPPGRTKTRIGAPPNEWFFKLHPLNISPIPVVYLKEQFLWKNEDKFFLEVLRNGSNSSSLGIKPGQLTELSTFLFPFCHEVLQSEQEFTYVCATKKQAANYNQKKLRELPDFNGSVTLSAIDTNFVADDHSILVSSLTICKGALVCITISTIVTSITGCLKLNAGTLAKVEQIHVNSNGDDYVELQLLSDEHLIVNVRRITDTCEVLDDKKCVSTLWKRVQFPFILGWSLHFNLARFINLTSVFIDMSNQSKLTFTHGCVYGLVASLGSLSYLKGLKGCKLKEHLFPLLFASEQDALDFDLKCLQVDCFSQIREQPLPTIPEQKVSDQKSDLNDLVTKTDLREGLELIIEMLRAGSNTDISDKPTENRSFKGPDWRLPNSESKLRFPHESFSRQTSDNLDEFLKHLESSSESEAEPETKSRWGRRQQCSGNQEAGIDSTFTSANVRSLIPLECWPNVLPGPKYPPVGEGTWSDVPLAILSNVETLNQLDDAVSSSFGGQNSGRSSWKWAKGCLCKNVVGRYYYCSFGGRNRRIADLKCGVVALRPTKKSQRTVNSKGKKIVRRGWGSVEKSCEVSCGLRLLGKIDQKNKIAYIYRLAIQPSELFLRHSHSIRGVSASIKEVKFYPVLEDIVKSNYFLKPSELACKVSSSLSSSEKSAADVEDLLAKLPTNAELHHFIRNAWHGRDVQKSTVQLLKNFVTWCSPPPKNTEVKPCFRDEPFIISEHIEVSAGKLVDVVLTFSTVNMLQIAGSAKVVFLDTTFNLQKSSCEVVVTGVNSNTVKRVQPVSVSLILKENANTYKRVLEDLALGVKNYTHPTGLEFCPKVVINLETS